MTDTTAAMPAALSAHPCSIHRARDASTGSETKEWGIRASLLPAQGGSDRPVRRSGAGPGGIGDAADDTGVPELGQLAVGDPDATEDLVDVLAQQRRVATVEAVRAAR